MKAFLRIFVALAVAALTVAGGPAYADRGGHSGRGGFVERGGGHWSGGGGHWGGGGGHWGGGGGHWSGRVYIGPGWWGPGWWGYPYDPYYYYPYYASPPVVIQQPPEIYVQPAPQVETPTYWYYCPDPQGYYPYVKKCPKGWLKVVPPAATPEGEE